MDADLSHEPRYIPAMLAEIRHADVVLGSRFVAGGADIDRNEIRAMLTRMSILYIRLIMGLNIHDPNSGYRCYRREALAAIAHGLESRDADIVQEVLYKLWLKGYRIKEIPIVFKDRIRGETTKTARDFVKGLYIVLKWRWRRAMGSI